VKAFDFWNAIMMHSKKIPFALLYIRANAFEHTQLPDFPFVVIACPEVSKDIEPRTENGFVTFC